MNLFNLDCELRESASEYGFSEVGVIPVTLRERDSGFLDDYIENEFNASMEYLSRNREVRRNPRLLLTGAKSIIVLLSSYKHDLPEENCGFRIASYAHGFDYHKILKNKMHSLVSVLRKYNPDVRCRVFTDSAPLFERSLAHEAGLGFIGKNSFLISPDHGLHTFLSVIITDMELLYEKNNPVVSNKCGECRRCIDACPTGAIVSPFRIDSRRCISYHTIENREYEGEHGKIIAKSNYIFGCDICMDVCPWSRKGRTTSIVDFLPLEVDKGRYVTSLSYREWNEMGGERFLRFFKGSALERAGLDKIKSNLEYVVANNNR